MNKPFPKRIFITPAVVAFLFYYATCAGAIEIRPSGTVIMFTQWATGTDLGFKSPYSDPGLENDFRGAQRLYFKVDINPHEEISATAFLEVDTVWGGTEPRNTGTLAGGQIGTHGVNVATKNLFMTWRPESLPLTMRAGIYGVALPNQIGGNLILYDDVATIVTSYKISETMNSTFLWARPYAHNPTIESQHTSMDIFALSYTLQHTHHTMTPYVAFTRFGRNVSGTPLGSAWSDGGNFGMWNGFSDFSGYPNAFWAAFSGKFHIGTDVTLLTDFLWGTLDGGHKSASRQGAVLLAELDWMLPHMTLGIIGWWASGDSASAYKDGAGRMPFINNQWGLTDFGYYRSSLTTESNLILQDATGRWTIGLIVDDLHWTNTLSSMLKVLYMQGTNSPEIVKNSRFSASLLEGGYRNNWGTYLTTHDWLIEVDFENTLQLQEDLSLIWRTGYIHIEVDPDVWGTSDTSDAFRTALLLTYTF